MEKVSGHDKWKANAPEPKEINLTDEQDPDTIARLIAIKLNRAIEYAKEVENEPYIT